MLLCQLLSLLLALLLSQLLFSSLIRLLFCELGVVALLLLLNSLPFRRLLSKQLLLLLQMLTLEGRICGARRRWAEGLRQLLRVDGNCRRSGTLACRARLTYGLTSGAGRWRRDGSLRRMYHGRYGRRRQFDSRGYRRPACRYALNCAGAQGPSAIRLDGFLPPLEHR